eukprot:CAMPEP_0202745864 /NCGR_PEP_ID=MMETSP1388-20130828/7696_1 /ASSEMBLY_ACC=CAM_ASM_000864 /TAXON_ID=37098 /ORGANISM="Isochrysis sp, Strain CCMP1244" /LENGTH=105 /DNA_ID=CAMNT_0049413079 /DNA_START=68 /DNA_END=383 /DNA_ORIENTATION=+
MSAAGDRAACLAASPGETRRRARRQAPGRRAGGGGGRVEAAPVAQRLVPREHAALARARRRRDRRQRVDAERADASQQVALEEVLKAGAARLADLPADVESPANL